METHESSNNIIDKIISNSAETSPVVVEGNDRLQSTTTTLNLIPNHPKKVENLFHEWVLLEETQNIIKNELLRVNETMAKNFENAVVLELKGALGQVFKVVFFWERFCLYFAPL